MVRCQYLNKIVRHTISEESQLILDEVVTFFLSHGAVSFLYSHWGGAIAPNPN